MINYGMFRFCSEFLITETFIVATYNFGKFKFGEMNFEERYNHFMGVQLSCLKSRCVFQTF